jgi:hypothetical protein
LSRAKLDIVSKQGFQVYIPRAHIIGKIKKMSTAKARSKVKLVKSENKWGRSNRRHYSRQNRRKKTSDGYEFEKKPRKLVLGRFTGDSWIPCPSDYTRGQGWGVYFTRPGSDSNARTIRETESHCRINYTGRLWSRRFKLIWELHVLVSTTFSFRRSSFPLR